MKAIKIVSAMAVCALLGLTASAWEYNKNEDHPDGSKSVDQLKKDGEYYIVKGSDLHNLAGDLIGKKIKFNGYVREISKFPARKVLFLSEDKCYFVIMPFGDTLGKVPEDLQKRLENNDIRAAGGIINKYDGDKLTLYCTIEMLCKEGGMTGSTLIYKSCIVKPVDKWKKGWTE